jgi:2-amino-4-hydroxy-6-hydroxymethyldihydropteridine diphosphokinase
MNIIFLGLGTNTGDRAMNLKKSIFALKNKGINIIAQSKIYETSPWGYTDQPDFLNACIKAETELSAEELLLTLKSLEKELGREESFRWGPRLIDIDILYFNSETISRNDLDYPPPWHS